MIGDSISAGLKADGRNTWPEVLRRRHKVDVVNLAHPAATVESAMDQAEKVKDQDVVVLLEIGGNDLLGSTPARDFETRLEKLIQEVRGPGRTLVMFELPLLPFRNRYGLAQRRVAKAYGIKLIPKRLFAGVLTSPGATVDGIHLSETGHAKMAEVVGGVIR